MTQSDTDLEEMCSEYWEKNPFSRGLVVEDSKCLGELIEIDLEVEEK